MYEYLQYAKAYPQYFGSAGPKPPVPEPEHPEYFTYGVTNISKLYGVTGLKDEYKDIKEITIPKVSDEGIAVEAIGVDAFKNSTIEKVHIQSNVLAIGNRAFQGTGSLIECTIDEGVNKVGYGIFSHSSLSEITIPNSLNNYGSAYDAFGQDSNITKVIFKEGRTKIPDNICSKMTKLTEVVIPNTVTEIGNSAFIHCNSLRNFDLWEGLEKVGSSILGYTAVSEITIPNSLNNYGSDYNAFGQDSNITKVTFKEGRTKIPAKVCASMTKLTEVVIPDTVTEIGNGAFTHCNSLRNFDLWEGLEKVGSSILAYTAVSEITIPNSLSTYGSGYDTFGQDSNITKVIFKEGRTNIVKNTCEKMMKLVNVVVPKSIKTIGNYAFNLCSKLTTVEYAGNETEYAQITIGTGNDYFKNATVTYNG